MPTLKKENPNERLQNGPASAGSPFVAAMANVHMDKDRGLILRQFPEYELDATQLLYSDTYVQYDNLLVQTLNGDYINLGNYVKKTEFNEYYPSILTELEFRDRISFYYNKKESNELFQNIRDNYVTNLSFNKFVEKQKEDDKEINRKIDENTSSINTINTVTIPTLKTISSFNEDIAKYTNTEDLNKILATYTNTNNLNDKLQEIRDTHTNYKTENDARSLGIENAIADIYRKSYIDSTFALYYNKVEMDAKNTAIEKKIKANLDSITNINNNIELIYRNKVDNSSFKEFKDDSYRKAEIDKKIRDVNAYTKPEMNSIVSGINTAVENTNIRINDTNTRINNMYTNIQHDTRHNNLDYRVKTNLKSIEDIKDTYTPLTTFNSNLSTINEALNARYTKTEINNILFENNKLYYTKEEINGKNNDSILEYDRTNKQYIANYINNNNKLYLSLLDFKQYKDTIFTKTEVNNTFDERLAEYDKSTVVDTKINNNYETTKTEYTSLLNTRLANHYEKSYIDTKFSNYRTTEEGTNYVKETLKSYVTMEKFVNDLKNVPSIQVMSDTIYGKLEENNRMLDKTIANHIDNKMLVFYDYLLNNSGIFYTKQVMDIKLSSKEDKSLSMLRFKHLENRIDKFYKKFITYYTKDEVDSKFTYYFSNVNIADATLYYTSTETDRMMAEKVDKTTYELFHRNTYNKDYVDDELDKKVDVSIYNSEVIKLHENDTNLKNALDEFKTFINGDFNNNINSRFTSMEDTLNEKIKNNKDKIDTHTTKIDDLTTLSQTFKNEAQVKSLITEVTDTKVSKADYDLEKLTFAKDNDLKALKSKLDTEYTNTITMNQNIKDVRDIVPSDEKIDGMIDSKLRSYTNSNDLLRVVSKNITDNSNSLKTTITDETDTKLTKYTTLKYLSDNIYTKEQSNTKFTELKRELTEKDEEITNELTTYKTFVNNNFVKNTGGSITGNLNVSNELNVNNYIFNNDGIKLNVNSTNYNVFNLKDSVSDLATRKKDITFADSSIENITFSSTKDLIHKKYNADASSNVEYKIITEEVFNPYKDTIFTKDEMNSKLNDKLDKSTFDTKVSEFNSSLGTKQELNTYKEEVKDEFKKYHTIETYKQFLTENYAPLNTFETFKTTVNEKIEQDLETKLTTLKSNTENKLRELNDTLAENVRTVNTEITSKLTGLENNTFKKTEINSKLDLKADKTDLQGVLYSAKEQFTSSLKIGSINVKLENTDKNLFVNLDKYGINLENTTDNITRKLFNANINSDNKYNMDIGEEGLDNVNIIGKNIIISDKTNNITSPVATKKMVDDTKSSLENTITTKNLELDGKITNLNTEVNKKLNKAGGEISGNITFTSTGTILLNNGNNITLDMYYNEYKNTATGNTLSKKIQIPLVSMGEIRPEEKVAKGFNNSSNSGDLLLFGNYVPVNNVTSADCDYMIKRNDDKQIDGNNYKVNPEVPNRIILPTANILVPYNMEDTESSGIKYHSLKLSSLVHEEKLKASISRLEESITEKAKETKQSVTGDMTDIERRLKTYVEQQIATKFDEIGRILDRINGA